MKEKKNFPITNEDMDEFSKRNQLFDKYAQLWIRREFIHENRQWLEIGMAVPIAAYICYRFSKRLTYFKAIPLGLVIGYSSHLLTGTAEEYYNLRIKLFNWKY